MSLIDFHLHANAAVITCAHAPHRCSRTGKGPVTTASPDGQRPCQGPNWHQGQPEWVPSLHLQLPLTTIPGLDLIRDSMTIPQAMGPGSLLTLPGQLTGNVSRWEWEGALAFRDIESAGAPVLWALDIRVVSKASLARVCPFPSPNPTRRTSFRVTRHQGCAWGNSWALLLLQVYDCCRGDHHSHSYRQNYYSRQEHPFRSLCK